MNCVLTLPLTSRKLSLGCISFVFRYLLVSQNTKKKMSAWPWQHFLKISPRGIEPNDRFSIHSVCQSHSIQQSLLVETRPTPIIFFCWKHYTFLLCKWSRSASLTLFSPPSPELSVLLKGNTLHILMPFLFYFHPTLEFNINHAQDPKSYTNFFHLSLSCWISRCISISAYFKQNSSLLSHGQSPGWLYRTIP